MTRDLQLLRGCSLDRPWFVSAGNASLSFPPFKETDSISNSHMKDRDVRGVGHTTFADMGVVILYQKYEVCSSGTALNESLGANCSHKETSFDRFHLIRLRMIV